MKRIFLPMIALLLIVSVLWAGEIKFLPDMTTSSLPTSKHAEDAIVRYVIVQSKPGLSATETPSAKVSFLLGNDVAEFGKQGDRVWQVHLIEFAQTKRIAWINAENGKVKFIYPEGKWRLPNQAL
jgi:hypothetical protein